MSGWLSCQRVDLGGFISVSLAKLKVAYNLSEKWVEIVKHQAAADTLSKETEFKWTNEMNFREE